MIHVKENFNVVAQKAYWLENQPFISFRGNGVESFFDRGTDPWASARTLALKCEPPLGNLRNAFGHQLGSVARFFSVGVGPLPGSLSRPYAGSRFGTGSGGLDSSGGDAMSREQYRHGLTSFFG